MVGKSQSCPAGSSSGSGAHAARLAFRGALVSDPEVDVLGEAGPRSRPGLPSPGSAVARLAAPTSTLAAAAQNSARMGDALEFMFGATVPEVETLR